MIDRCVVNRIQDDLKLDESKTDEVDEADEGESKDNRINGMGLTIQSDGITSHNQNRTFAT